MAAMLIFPVTVISLDFVILFVFNLLVMVSICRSGPEGRGIFIFSFIFISLSCLHSIKEDPATTLKTRNTNDDYSDGCISG